MLHQEQFVAFIANSAAMRTFCSSDTDMSVQQFALDLGVDSHASFLTVKLPSLVLLTCICL